MMSLAAIDQILMHHAEKKIVWPFEYGRYGTRFTIVRVAALLSGVLFLGAVASSAYIPEMHYRLFYMGVGMAMIFFFDSWLQGAEQHARALGGEPNAYRERLNWRLCWLAFTLVCFLMGLFALSVSPIEGLCRILMSFIAVLGLYVYSADPVPSTWAPRPKRLNW